MLQRGTYIKFRAHIRTLTTLVGAKPTEKYPWFYHFYRKTLGHQDIYDYYPVFGVVVGNKGNGVQVRYVKVNEDFRVLGGSGHFDTYSINQLKIVPEMLAMDGTILDLTGVGEKGEPF